MVAPEPEPVVPEPVAAAPVRAPALVTLALFNQRQVYWEIAPAVLEQLSSHAPGGRALVRVLSFRTRAGKVERQTRDFAVNGAAGSAVLEGLRSDTVVRAALGWESNGQFRAFLIGSDLIAATAAARTPFRAHAAVGALPADIEQRAALHLSRRSSH